jgi:hypothetical protein
MKYLKYFENNTILYHRILGYSNILEFINKRVSVEMDKSLIDLILQQNKYVISKKLNNNAILITNIGCHEIEIRSYEDEWFLLIAATEDSDDSWSEYHYECDTIEGVIQCLNYVKNQKNLE